MKEEIINSIVIMLSEMGILEREEGRRIVCVIHRAKAVQRGVLDATLSVNGIINGKRNTTR